MALSPGTRLGPYEITAQIGAGGMGEVYQATDTKLKRQVAIKVLPAAVASDHERLARFQREAEVLASLNHPNIAAIYGLEDTAASSPTAGGQGTIALVMELVEGPTLADRIADGAIPVDEALPIANQIAEALEAAHEQGIIHRDLKPANVKVRPDGTVKVLDFGLAKAMEPTGVMSSGMSQMPTITTPAMTQAGMILGTAAYMSPEQARGKTVDRRADIWAFGAVLYEMLTGTRAFEGEDIADTLGNVMKVEPTWQRVPASMPPRVVQVMRACLQKNPKQRLDSAQGVRLALAGAFETPAGHAIAPAMVRSRATAVAAGAVGALLVGALAAAALWPRVEAPRAAAPARLSVTLPANRPVPSLRGYPSRSLALSPDGTQLVYVGRNQEVRNTQLQLRSLATLVVRDLPGTAGAVQPFFSPDGQWVGFFTTTGELKKIAVAGGNPITLVEDLVGSPWAFGVWAEDDTIIYGAPSQGLRQVSAEGGEPTDLTTLDAAEDRLHLSPSLVPSNQAVLFTVQSVSRGDLRIEAVLRDSGERRVVVENARHPHVLASGHLLFQRDDTILVVPFDTTSLTVTGTAVSLIDDVGRDDPNYSYPVAQLAVSRNGTLAYLPRAENAGELVLVTRDGTFERLGTPPGDFGMPRVSPNGQAVAFLETRGTQTGTYVYDLVRATTTRLGQGGSDQGLAWHPDNRSIAVTGQGTEGVGIILRGPGGTERPLVPVPAGVSLLRTGSWSPDGTRLAYMSQRGDQYDVWLVTMGDEPTTEPFLAGPSQDRAPAFSPDGRWLAYESDESGRSEVHIQQFPQGERFVVSTDGGRAPVWRRDGREIFFASPREDAIWMMAVTVTTKGDTLTLGRPQPLFEMEAQASTGPTTMYGVGSNAGPEYDVLPDGRFVMVQNTVTPAREIVLVQNWTSELQRPGPAD